MVNYLQYYCSNTSIKKSTTRTCIGTETRGALRALTPLNEFFLALCRLRRSVMENDLAYHFGISQPTKIILHMDHCFNEFMPKVFKDTYPTNLYYQQRI